MPHDFDPMRARGELFAGIGSIFLGCLMFGSIATSFGKVDTEQMPADGSQEILKMEPESSDYFEQLVKRCAPDVHPQTMRALVTTESSHNPYAIGVVDGALAKQPRSRDEALQAIEELVGKGANFSLGLAQVNRYNLERYGQTYESILDACTNIRVGADILKECFTRAIKRTQNDQQALRDALSCYYSGNFRRGYEPENGGSSYVERIIAATSEKPPQRPIPAIDPAAKVSSPEPKARRRDKKADDNQDWASFAEATLITEKAKDTQAPLNEWANY